MKKEVIITPIFYMGNKKKLIKKGLIDLFPQNINTFVDVFGGSGIVSMNVSANKYCINDSDKNLIKLYELFTFYNANLIITTILQNIEKYNLPKERTKRNVYQDKDKIEEYKQAYNSLRSEFNKTRNVFDFYTLMFFSFSQQFRFNSKGEFNMPYGMDCYTEKNDQYICNGCNFFRSGKVTFTNLDFRELKIHNIKPNDFVYFDPPYLDTTAVYNENGGWVEKDEQDLYEICEKLHKNNIKFGMSNVFTNKEKKSQMLIDWCEQNNWNVYTFDKHTYSACGKGNSNASEVLITNY